MPQAAGGTTVAALVPMDLEPRDPRFHPGVAQREPMWPRRGESATLLGGAFWMVVISVALFFMPLVNGLIGGFVGGYMVGTPKRGLVAAILPAVIVAIATWLLLALVQLPVFGLVAGFTVLMLVLLADVGLFIGAALGGAVAARSNGRAIP
jgi:hypothetical protein